MPAPPRDGDDRPALERLTTGRLSGIFAVTGELDPTRCQAGIPYGASHVSNNGATPPDETALASARFQDRRVAEVAAKLAGVPELVAAD